MGENTCYNLENKNTAPLPDTAEKLADALDVSVSDLFDEVTKGHLRFPTTPPGQCAEDGCESQSYMEGLCRDHAALQQWPLPPPEVTAEMPREGWQEDGSCYLSGRDDFYPEGETPPPAVVRMCSTCDVRGDCVAFSFTLPELWDQGIWGGMNERQRRKYEKELAKQGITFVREENPIPADRPARRRGVA